MSEWGEWNPHLIFFFVIYMFDLSRQYIYESHPMEVFVYDKFFDVDEIRFLSLSRFTFEVYTLLVSQLEKLVKAIQFS